MALVHGHEVRADRRKYLVAKKGYKSTAGIFTHVLQPLLGTETVDRAFKLINGILPGFSIDARGARFSELVQYTISSRLDGAEAFLTSRAWEPASNHTKFPSAPNKDSSSPLTAGQ